MRSLARYGGVARLARLSVTSKRAAAPTLERQADVVARQTAMRTRPSVLGAVEDLVSCVSTTAVEAPPAVRPEILPAAITIEF
jgi:hypothetical protein